MEKTLKGVNAKLKPNGRFLALEPGCGNFYCEDPVKYWLIVYFKIKNFYIYLLFIVCSINLW